MKVKVWVLLANGYPALGECIFIMNISLDLNFKVSTSTMVKTKNIAWRTVHDTMAKHPFPGTPHQWGLNVPFHDRDRHSWSTIQSHSGLPTFKGEETSALSLESGSWASVLALSLTNNEAVVIYSLWALIFLSVQSAFQDYFKKNKTKQNPAWWSNWQTDGQQF